MHKATAPTADFPRIGVVAGNGLTIDFCRLKGIYQTFDPSEPFSWSFTVPGRGDLPWQEAFPLLTRKLGAPNSVTSFDSFARLLEDAGQPDDHTRLDCEARHFLAFAYSTLQERMASFGVNGWQWAEWIKKYCSSICAAVSLNYDLLLEDCLLYGKANTKSTFLSGGSGPLLHKPHGSVDYECAPSFIRMSPVSYPLQNWVTLNDVPLILLPRDKLRQGRRQVTLVLPSESSPYLNHQWVRPGYKAWEELAGDLTHCVFIGISYWRCDRQELDHLLQHLNRDALVISANPCASEEFVAKVSRDGFRHEHWPNGPRSLAM